MTRQEIRRSVIASYVAGLILIICSIAFFGIIYFGVFHERVPIEYLNSPFPVEPAEIKSGEQLLIYAEWCRYTDVPVTIYRTFISDDQQYPTLPTEYGGAERGCGSATLPVHIPNNLPVGTYHVHYRMTYLVNPIAMRVVDVETQEFTITD